MPRLYINTSPIPSSGPFSPPDYDFSMLSSPINLNAIARRLRRQGKDEDEDDVASIITLNVDDVLGDVEKSGHCLVRMECLSASSGSTYSPYGDDNDDEPQSHPLSRDASEGQEPRGSFPWNNHSIDYPESVGWDSNSETQYSRSETYSTASVGYVKIALSAEIKSSSDEGKVSPPRQIIYHSPTLPDYHDFDSCDVSVFDSVMLKRAETLQEVSMVEHLNSEELRRDPWNPVVPLLTVVNTNEPDDEAAILILERLQPWDAVPYKTVRDVIDLTRQLLQGLVFLHDQNIAHQGISPDTIMVATGDAPTDTSWERSEYDVRYYLVDFSHATRVTDNQQVGLDLRHAAQSIKVIVGQTLPELSPLLRKMANQESTQMTAPQALGELESIVQSVPASRMFAPLR